MAVISRLTAVLALSALVLVANPVSADSAVVAHNQHPQARAVAHHAAAKRANRRRSPAKRGKCKPRTSTTSTPSSTVVAVETTTTKPPKTPTSTKEEVPATTSKASGGGNNGGSNGGNGGRKAGLGWNNGVSDTIKQFTSTGKVGWIYTWSSWDPRPAGLDIEFVPMMWGNTDEQIKHWNKNYDASKHKSILGFNEPDLDSQSGMSAGQAAKLWWELINDKPSFKVSPAPSGGPSGKKWLVDFMNACSGCDIDAIGVHYYGTNAGELINFVTDMHNTFNKPVWVTEFACMRFGGGHWCSVEDAMDFNKAVTDFFQGTPWVQRYAAFGSLTDMYNVNENCRLMTGGKQITDLGRQYIAW